MGEMGEIFQVMREASKEKRANNLIASLELLRSRGYIPQQLSDTHFRVGDFDFWPSTGKYLNRKTKLMSRGVRNLLTHLDKDKSG